MERWKEFGSFAMFIFCMLAPFAIMLGISAVSGTASDVSDLGIFGPSARFTCEWASDDGNQAVLTTSGGSRRFVDLGQRHSRIEIGKQYKLESKWLHKFAMKTYLVSA